MNTGTKYIPHFLMKHFNVNKASLHYHLGRTNTDEQLVIRRKELTLKKMEVSFTVIGESI